MTDLPTLLQRQRTHFASNITKPYRFRMEMLKALRKAIKKYEEEICAALKADLNKSKYESYLSEIGLVLEEIRFTKNRLKEWMQPRQVASRITNFPASSYIYAEPHGCVLIISPWNYPFYLTMTPVVGAIAAGNCMIIKPSEIAPNTASIMKKILDETFPDEFIHAEEGGAEVSKQLLDLQFDYIFFTGSTAVGKIVAEAAAKNLTPVTLELGGKSPCIVDRDVDITLAAKRIAWGKLLNAGQTCIAPDYLYVHRSVKQQLIEAIKKNLEKFYSNGALDDPDYPHIISEKHFTRLSNFLSKGEILIGGKTDAAQRSIEPTLIGNVTWNDPVMREEIFGPIFPVLEFEGINEVINAVNENPRPLSLYVFSKNKKIQQRVLNETSFGGGMINDTVEHIINPNLPFGGVGQSGVGAYHGKFSFDTFTHYKRRDEKNELDAASVAVHAVWKKKFMVVEMVFTVKFF